MRKFFYGKNPKPPYFEGWYFKLQGDHGRSIALIPAMLVQKNGHRSASIQIISETDAWWIEYPFEQFSASEDHFFVQIGECIFSEQGIHLSVQKDGLSLSGSVSFGKFLPISSDIMGPFCWLPNMECSHSVISMKHRLEGTLILNGEQLDYNNGIGYIEADRGRSFRPAICGPSVVGKKPALCCQLRPSQCLDCDLQDVSAPFFIMERNTALQPTEVRG